MPPLDACRGHRAEKHRRVTLVVFVEVTHRVPNSTHDRFDGLAIHHAPTVNLSVQRIEHCAGLVEEYLRLEFPGLGQNDHFPGEGVRPAVRPGNRFHKAMNGTQLPAHDSLATASHAGSLDSALLPRLPESPRGPPPSPVPRPVPRLSSVLAGHHACMVFQVPRGVEVRLELEDVVGLRC